MNLEPDVQVCTCESMGLPSRLLIKSLQSYTITTEIAAFVISSMCTEH